MPLQLPDKGKRFRTVQWTAGWATVLLAMLSFQAPARDGPEFMFVGTWNNIDPNGPLGFPLGVYGFRLGQNGELEPLGLVAETTLSAESLAASPDGRTLYVSEYDGCICTRSWPFPGSPRPGIAAYRVAPESGKLTFVSRVDSHGAMPAEFRVDGSGRTLALVNYYGANVVTFRLDGDGGFSGLVSNHRHEGESTHASAGAHPHGLAFSPDNGWLYVADQGLDRLYAYRFDATSSGITPADVPYFQFTAGEGPRNVAVHPNGRWIYTCTEQSGLVHLFTRDGDGRFTDHQSIPLVPEGSKLLLGAAQAKVSPDGRFLYVNHRPNENIAVFAIDQQSGRLTLVEFAESSAHRATLHAGRAELTWEQKSLWQKVQTGARAFAWDSGASMIASANLGEDAITFLERDPLTGRLTLKDAALSVPQPSFVLFVRPR